MATTNIYKSVLLQPNEQFTLPPGAELIAAESADDLDSTCDLPTTDTIECYTSFILLGGNEGTDSQAWEIEEGVSGGDVKLMGFATRNGSSTTITNFTSPYTFSSLTGMSPNEIALKSELEAKLSGVFSIQVVPIMNDPTRRFKLYITLKTTSEIAGSIFMILTTTSEGVGTVYVPFQLHSSIDDGGANDKPNCS